MHRAPDYSATLDPPSSLSLTNLGYLIWSKKSIFAKPFRILKKSNFEFVFFSKSISILPILIEKIVPQWFTNLFSLNWHFNLFYSPQTVEWLQWGCKSFRLAQLEEDQTFKLRVVGSSPTLGHQYFNQPWWPRGLSHQQCSNTVDVLKTQVRIPLGTTILIAQS